jgi:hypothetical protein
MFKESRRWEDGVFMIEYQMLTLQLDVDMEIGSWGVRELGFGNELIQTRSKEKYPMDGFIKGTLNITKELKLTQD